jgi:hypothetical protein
LKPTNAGPRIGSKVKRMGRVGDGKGHQARGGGG